jgi:hypothetical protein
MGHRLAALYLRLWRRRVERANAESLFKQAIVPWLAASGARSLTLLWRRWHRRQDAREAVEDVVPVTTANARFARRDSTDLASGFRPVYSRKPASEPSRTCSESQLWKRARRPCRRSPQSSDCEQFVNTSRPDTRPCTRRTIASPAHVAAGLVRRPRRTEARPLVDLSDFNRRKCQILNRR